MKDALFNDKYKALNKEQKLAVDTIEGPVMVIAGPGTGKTTILTLRIANILKETDTPASGILALTFTDSGVKSMKKKLREIVGTRADEVHIHTFHSFAGSVFTEFPDHFPSLFRTKQITEIEAENIIRKILENKNYSKLRPFGEPDFYVGKILKAISDLKKESFDPEAIINFAELEIVRLKKDPSSISSKGPTKGELKADVLKQIEKCEKTIVLGKVYKEYEIIKKEERLLDYDDLLIKLLEALKNDSLLLSLLQEKFLYVHIDEHQDTNDSQNSIVMKLISYFDMPNVFVVGDEKQAIYRFQGASVQNFLKFKEVWKDMKTIPLKSNYRSHQAILDAVFSMIEKNYEDGEHSELRVKLVSESKGEKPIDIINTPDTFTQDINIVDSLKKILDENKDSTIALVVRKNREVEHFLSLCENNNIDASAERGVNIFTDSFGVLYFELLQFIADPSDVESFSNTLVKGLWGVEFQESILLIKKLRSGDYTVLDSIDKINAIKSEITKLGVIDFLVYLASVSGYGELVKSSPIASAVWRAIIDLSREIAERENIQDPAILINELLKYKKTAESKSIKIGSGSVEARVSIMTAHSSKGLEYDFVFLPNATEESWSSRNFGSSFVFPFSKEEGDEIKDTRRLFYVAITRAKKHVQMYVPQESAGGKELTPLRFIDELHPKFIHKTNIARTTERSLELNISDILKNRDKEAVEYTKRVLLEKGLSVTALNHYLRCGKEFFYKSILKLPEPPHPHSEKGIAMHKGFSEVWRTENRSSENIKKILDKNIVEYFKTSLLPKFEKEVLEKEILEYTDDISKDLAPHFTFSGPTYVEKWEERDIDVNISNNTKIVILHGQLDCIQNDEKVVRIFDYKTTEVKSIKEIKGENKNSNKDYFRQLVFYKYLLSENHNYRDKKIIPALVFVEPDRYGKCAIVELPINEEDIEELKTEIDTLVQGVWSGDFLKKDCDQSDCKYCRTK
jgi:DNA helicase-2/ATP-dependent DNA helicase PcrA